MIPRPSYEKIFQKLASEKSMVFLAGPRQVGKTTLAKHLQRSAESALYFNWDNLEDRRKLAADPYFFQHVERHGTAMPLIILDEIHKYNRWKAYLKGVYDGFGDRFLFLILGSGRFSVYQKGGDALTGRFRSFSMWPLTLSELTKTNSTFATFRKFPLRLIPSAKGVQETWERLAQTSGFPEPFSHRTQDAYRRWALSYDQQLIRQDIRDLTSLKHLDQVEMLYNLLPAKVGSPLSLENLAQALNVAFNSVHDWLEVFESFYLVFRLTPWSGSMTRSIRKSRKLYFYDYARIVEPGPKFENQVAVELLRAVTNWNELGLGRFSLHYVRTKDGEEVDFLLAEDGKPWLLVETKLNDTSPDRSLIKFQNQLKIPALQLVNRAGTHKLIKNDSQDLAVVSASAWLAALP